MNSIKKSLFLAPCLCLFLFGKSLYCNETIDSKNIRLDGVEAIVDNVHETNLAAQLQKIFRVELGASDRAKEALMVRLGVNQHSFYRGIDSINSIYVHFVIYSAEGECLFENGFYSEGKKTIHSVFVQKNQIGRAAKSVRRFVKSFNKGRIVEALSAEAV